MSAVTIQITLDQLARLPMDGTRRFLLGAIRKAQGAQTTRLIDRQTILRELRRQRWFEDNTWLLVEAEAYRLEIAAQRAYAAKPAGGKGRSNDY